MSGPVSPVEANALFEVLAADPPTAAEQSVVREQFSAVRWLGDYNVPCTLGRAYEVDGRTTPHEPLQAESSEMLAGTHISRFSDTLAIMRDGERSTARLGELTRQFVDRSIVKQGSVWERVPGDGYHIGQFVVYATESDIDIAEKPEHNRSLFMPNLLRLDLSREEKLFVSTDSLMRYRVKQAAGGLAVTSEKVHSLKEGDPDYFDRLHEDIQAYKDNLLETLNSAGVDPATLTDPDTGKLRYLFLDEAVDPIIKDTYINGQIPQSLIGRMGARLSSIWESIRYERSYNPTSGAVEDVGIHATGFRVRSYFEALLMQVPSSDG